MLLIARHFTFIAVDESALTLMKCSLLGKRKVWKERIKGLKREKNIMSDIVNNSKQNSGAKQQLLLIHDIIPVLE